MKKIYLSSLLVIMSLVSDTFAAAPVNLLSGTQPISRKAIVKALESYKSMPTSMPWNLAGNTVYSAKAGFLKCIEQFQKVTATDFGYCCGVSKLGADTTECVNLLQQTISIHNDMVKSSIKVANANVCSAEDLKAVKNATAGRYVMINGVYKCVATQCAQGYYLKRNAKGESQGWCAYGTDTYVQRMEPISLEGVQLSSALLDTDFSPEEIQNRITAPVLADDPEFAAKIQAIQAEADAEKEELVKQALADQSKKQESQLREQGKQMLAAQKEELKQEKKINRLEAQQEKLQQKIDANTQDKELQKKCDEMDLSKSDCKKYKKDPEAFMVEYAKQQECDRMNLSKSDCAAYHKDPDGFLIDKAKEDACKQLNLNAVEFNKCKKDPVAYKLERNEREVEREEAEKLRKDKKKAKADKKAAAAEKGLTVAEYERWLKNEATLKQLRED